MTNRRTKAALMVAIVSAAVAVLGAAGLLGRVHLVDIIQLFFGGLGAGAGLAAAIAALRRPRPNIFPALKYRNGPAAIQWLTNAFGFTKSVEMLAPDGTVAHAELKLGSGILLLGSIGTPDEKNPWSTTPGVYVYVKDVDAHYVRARAAGADIVREPHDTSYGAREYTARDLEGQLWSFGTYHPER